MTKAVLSCKCIYSLTVGYSNAELCSCIGHMMCRVLMAMVIGQIMFFLSFDDVADKLGYNESC